MNLIKSVREIEVIYLHCTATEPGKHVSIEAIRRYHMDYRGFKDIGYHYIVQPDGAVDLGRPVDKPGAHVRGDNSRSIGVCMVGNWNIAEPTRDDVQITETAHLLARLCYMYDIVPESYGLLLHRECHERRPFVPRPHKTCPGMNIDGRQMREFVQWHYDKMDKDGEFDD